MPRAITGMSTPCWRNHHENCQAPGSCECGCHEGESVPTPPKSIDVVEADRRARAKSHPPAKPVREEPPRPDPGSVVWETPPPKRGRIKRAPLSVEQRDALTARPSTWARVAEFTATSAANSAAMRVRKGHYEEMPPAQWELHAARHGTGSALWARYIGTAD